MVVYTTEAHPTDEWKMYTDICFEQPKTLSDRMDKARMYLDESATKIPIVVDGMDNKCEGLYSTWPERLYVILDGAIVYKGGMGPDDYSPAEMEAWLETKLDFAPSTTLEGDIDDD